MRVMVIVKATRESEEKTHPLETEGEAEMFEQMGKFNEELVKVGIMLVGDGLKPSRFGKRVPFNGTKRTVAMLLFRARVAGENKSGHLLLLGRHLLLLVPCLFLVTFCSCLIIGAAVAQDRAGLVRSSGTC